MLPGYRRGPDQASTLNFCLNYGKRIDGFDPFKQLAAKHSALSYLTTDCFDMNVFFDMPSDSVWKEESVLRLTVSKGESLWYVGRREKESFEWLREHIARCQLKEEPTLAMQFELLLSIFSGDTGKAEQLLHMIADAIGSGYLPDISYSRLTTCLATKLRSDLSDTCPHVLHDILKELRRVWYDEYIRVREDFGPGKHRLPKRSVPSDKLLDQVYRKYGYIDGTVHPKVPIVRSISNSIRQVDNALEKCHQQFMPPQRSSQ